MFKSRFDFGTYNVTYEELLNYYNNQLVLTPPHNHEEVFAWCRDSGGILASFIGTWTGNKDVWWVRHKEDMMLFKLAWS